jgi:hypothetical protein
MQAIRSDDPFPTGRFWTRSGRAQAQTTRIHGAKTLRLAGKALCRTRTDDPFLTMEQGTSLA